MAAIKQPTLPLPSSMSNPSSILSSPRDAANGGMNGSINSSMIKPSTTMANGHMMNPHHSTHVLPHPQYATTQPHTQTYAATHSGSPVGSTPLQSTQYYAQDSFAPSQYVNMDYPHLTQAQSSTPHTVTSSGGTLSSNGMSVGMSYPPQHLPSNYYPHSATHGGHSQYQFPTANGIPSPSHQASVTSAGMPTHINAMMPLPRGHVGSNAAPLPSASGSAALIANNLHNTANYSTTFDTTGQVAPPGVKPRVTATLWEDEGSLCFQVEAKGVCVARREDNHMINGTKLLNVAGMTRGRRDGILKSEKVRHVVKIGPMHLKGVWIPFERALDFANKEKITESLYPLFVHNINSLLYHPTNTPRTNAVVNMADRSMLSRQQQNQQQRQQQQHIAQQQQQQMQHRRPDGVVPLSSSMAPATNLQHLPAHHTLPSHHNSHLARPNMERSTSFPTPPSSSSSILDLASSAPQYWNGSNIAPVTQSLPVESSVSSRSMPTTPVTTPPNSSMQQLTPYPPTPYNDSYRPTQGSLTPQQQLTQHNANRFGGPLSQPQSQYANSSRNSAEMGPPATSRHQQPSSSRPSSRQTGDVKSDGAEVEPAPADQEEHEADHAEEEGDHEAEHENEYTHDDGQSYHATRGPYYSSIGPINGESPSHLSPALVASGQTSQNVNGVRSPYSTPNLAVPRTVETPAGTNARASGNNQSQWQSASDNSSYAMNPRNPNVGYDNNVYQANRSNVHDSQDNGYSTNNGMGIPMGASYASQGQPGMTSLSAGTKRGRDDDDDGHDSRSSSRTGDDRIGDENAIKRRKMAGASSPLINGTLGSNPRPIDRRSALQVQRGRR